METIIQLFLTLLACLIVLWFAFAVQWQYRLTPVWYSLAERTDAALKSIRPSVFVAFVLSVLFLIARVCA